MASFSRQSVASLKRRQLGFSTAKLLLIILVTIAVTMAATFFVVRTYIFPAPFTPVTLNVKEAQKLDKKLNQLGWQGEGVQPSRAQPRTEQSRVARASAQQSGASVTRKSHLDADGKLVPQAYSERDIDRRVTFSEKEVNAMIGRSPEFNQRVAIDFSNNLASATILIPVPRDFPIMAGEILRVNTGIDIRLDENRRPVVALVGVSLMGVPLPNAWLGNMKNVNLVSEFGDRGFWNAFADGVEDIEIRDGELMIQLRR